MIVQRKPVLLHVWKLPLAGRQPDVPAPKWLVEKMATGELQLNRHGGMQVEEVWGTRGCAPGDWVALDEFDRVVFIPAEHFHAEVMDAGLDSVELVAA